MGYLQWEEPCFYCSDSQDVEHERGTGKIISARAGDWILGKIGMFRTKEYHIFSIMYTQVKKDRGHTRGGVKKNAGQVNSQLL